MELYSRNLCDSDTQVDDYGEGRQIAWSLNTNEIIAAFVHWSRDTLPWLLSCLGELSQLIACAQIGDLGCICSSRNENNAIHEQIAR